MNTCQKAVSITGFTRWFGKPLPHYFTTILSTDSNSLSISALFTYNAESRGSHLGGAQSGSERHLLCPSIFACQHHWFTKISSRMFSLLWQNLIGLFLLDTTFYWIREGREQSLDSLLTCCNMKPTCIKRSLLLPWLHKPMATTPLSFNVEKIVRNQDMYSYGVVSWLTPNCEQAC